MGLIIERYLQREIVMTFVAVSVLLALMFLSSNFIILATETLEGDYPIDVFFSLFALKGVGNIVFILPLAFFISVLLALGRLYKDSEMTVLMACGVGPSRLFSSVGKLAVVVALIVGYLALYFAPWAAEQSKQLLDEAGARQEIEGIIAGRFNSFGPAGPTIYVERYESEKKRLYGLLVLGGRVNGKEGEQYVVKAAQAYERTDSNGTRYLVLQNGYRYEGTRGRRDYRITHFVEHGIRITERDVTVSRRPNYAIPTSRLWNSSSSGLVAELQWRLAIPISTLLLALLAVPLSKSSPRSGRYKGLFVGIIVYVIYNNLLTVGRSAISKEDIPLFFGLWWAHLLILCLLALLVWQQRRS
jgi:lipopolysaccharide export system permease protein